MTRRPHIHPAAARGFDREADSYDRGRPGYGSEVVGFLVEVLAIAPGSLVLDLAAGTGKLTRELLPTRARLVAVEPVGGMREVLARSLEGVEVLDGTAEHLPLPAASMDAVVIAQAFHWFDGPAAVREVARVLRPGGRIGIVFNVRDETDPRQAALETIWEPHRGDTPTHRGGAWKAAFAANSPFSSLRHRAFPTVQRLTPDELVDRVVSVSFIATLAEAERATVRQRVRELAGNRNEIVLPYRTDVFWAERLEP